MPDAEIAEFVRQRGYGEFVSDTVVTYPGRNPNMAGRTTSGTDVFAKRTVGPHTGHGARLEDLGPALTWHHLRWPAVLAADPDRRIHLTRWVGDARTAADAVTAGEFPDALAHALGAALGELHAARFTPDHLDRRPLPMPSVRVFSALSAAQYLESSGGLIELWRILQGDDHLKEAVANLRKDEKAAPQVPIHADLRLDQILVADGELLVTDWEEFRYGDAARDLGTTVGEFLHRSVVGIAAEEIDTAGADDEIVARGVRNLQEALPTLEAFTRGYRAVRPGRDRDLARRAVAFAGWHLLDRVMAAAAYGAELTPVHRAAVGVGRTALARPAAYVGVLGLEAL